MSLEGLLTNLVHGDHCAKYQIATISHANVFIGVVNHTCEAVTAFCPCSMVCNVLLLLTLMALLLTDRQTVPQLSPYGTDRL